MSFSDQRLARDVNGIIVVSSTVERNALVPWNGMLISRTDTNILERYNGTSWQEPGSTALAAHMPLAFHGTAGGTVSAGMAVASVGAITMSGAAVLSGYVLATTGVNSIRVLRPCVISLTVLFYNPATGDKRGAIGVGGTTWWWSGASSADQVNASLTYPFTAVTNILFSQLSATAANTTFTVDGYLIPMN